MNLNLKTFAQLVQDMGAALQSSASVFVDVSVGSIIRAIFEANASVVLWLQWLLLQILQATRASTSRGVDLDSWMADFGQLRLPATPSVGMVTFSRFAAGSPAYVYVGATVKTNDGGLSFTVAANPSLSTWQAASASYLIPSGVQSVDVPIVCTAGGSRGNVLSGTVSMIAASLPGVDQVANAQALYDGADAEGDQAFRQRFRTYLASLACATPTAVLHATANVRQGLNVAIRENIALDGTAQAGSFLVIIDDGTGFPSQDLLSAVAEAVEIVRPIGSVFNVTAPQVIMVSVALSVSFDTRDAAVLGTSVIQDYIIGYLNSLPIGQSASVTRVAQSAYLAGVSIRNISGITLNGSPVDIVPPSLAIIKAGQISVSVNDG